MMRRTANPKRRPRPTWYPSNKIQRSLKEAKMPRKQKRTTKPPRIERKTQTDPARPSRVA